MTNFKEHTKLAADKLPEGCLGYKSDLTPEECAGKHIAGDSGLVFETEEAYLAHVSPVTGHTPADIEHQDALTNGRASKIAAKAADRGEERKGEKEHPAVKLAKERGEKVNKSDKK